MILVVDDDPSIRRVLQRLLTDAGYNVTVASDGGEALEFLWAASPPFGLVITDIRMPHMNGWELARQLRRHWPDLPILYLSAFDTEFARFSPVATNTSAFLPKPFEPDELLRQVAVLLE